MVHVMKGFMMIISNHLTQVSGQGMGYNLNEVFFDKREKGVIWMLILSGERKLKW